MSDLVRFLSALYACVALGFIELRPIRPRGGALRQEFIPVSDLDRVERWAGALTEKANVYFGVAPRAREEGTKDAILEVPAVWVDLDTPGAPGRLVLFSPPPSAVIESGSPGKLHAYWFLEEPAPPHVAEALNRRLAEVLDGDRAAVDAGRILRLPETLNHKHDPPTEVRLIELSDRRYSVNELEAACPPVDSEAPPKASGNGKGQQDPRLPRILAQLDQVTPSGDGFSACCPAHGDEHPSFHVAQAEDGRILLHCFRGCSFEAMVEALGMAPSELGPRDARRSGRSRLMGIVEGAGVELFHDEREVPFALVPVEGHVECYEVGSTGFSRWLRREYYRQFTGTPSSEALSETLELFAAQALFDGERKKVHRRVGGDLQELLIDLGDPDWRTASVRDDGTWTILERSPVPFARDQGMLALPEPVPGGSLDDLRSVVWVPRAENWVLTKGGYIAMFHPFGPYFVMFITGVAGSAKSNLARRLASLCDPHGSQFLKDARSGDLLLAASKSWVVGLDNVSMIRRETSDLLCVISTGVGDRKRALYTDGELYTLEVRRPTIATSIGRVATRPDLVDRGLHIVNDQRIPDSQRRLESELDVAFNALRPRAFGATLTTLAGALKRLPHVTLPGLPRMADVTMLVTAGEPAMGIEEGTFYATVADAQKTALREAVQASPFVQAVVRLMQGLDRWEGAPEQLWKEAADGAHDLDKRRWPTNASVASKELDEHEIALNEHGIVFERFRRAGGNRERTLRLINTSRDAGRDGTRRG